MQKSAKICKNVQISNGSNNIQIISNSNETIVQNGVDMKNNCVYINGEKWPFPKGKSFNTTSVSIMDGRIFVNGYEFKNGRWRKTLKAWWHNTF